MYHDLIGAIMHNKNIVENKTKYLLKIPKLIAEIDYNIIKN